VEESILKRGLIAAGVEIQQHLQRIRQARPISPTANCAAMGLVSVLSMKKGCAVFAESLMPERLFKRIVSRPGVCGMDGELLQVWKKPGKSTGSTYIDSWSPDGYKYIET
jgi:hypothetical protein